MGKSNHKDKYDDSRDVQFEYWPDGVNGGLRIFGTDPVTGTRKEYSPEEYRAYHRMKVDRQNEEFGLAPVKWRD